MNLPGGWELVLVVLVIMVLFGAKRLPEASRSLGRSLRIFKAETKGLRDEDSPGYEAPAVTPKVVAAPADPRDDAAYQRWLASQPSAPATDPVPDPSQPHQP